MARKFVSGVLAFAMVFGATAPVVFAEPVATEVVDQEANYLPAFEKSEVTIADDDTAIIKLNDVEDGADLDLPTSSDYSFTYIKSSKSLVITAKTTKAAGRPASQEYTFTLKDLAQKDVLDANGNPTGKKEDLNNYATKKLTLTLKTPADAATWTGDWTPTTSGAIDLVAGKPTDLTITHGGTAPKSLTWKLTTAAQEYVSVSTSTVVENGVVKGTKVTLTGLKAIPDTEKRSVAITLTADGTPFAERKITVGTASSSAAVTLKVDSTKIAADASMAKGATLVAQAYKTNDYGDLVTDDDANLVWSINGKGDKVYAEKSTTDVIAQFVNGSAKNIKTFVAKEAGTYTITVSDAAGSHVATQTITVTSTVAPKVDTLTETFGYVAKSTTDLTKAAANQSKTVKPGSTVEIGGLPYAVTTTDGKAALMSSFSGWTVSYVVTSGSKYVSSYDATTGKFVLVDENDVDMKKALDSDAKKAVVTVKAVFSKNGSTVTAPYTINVTKAGAEAASITVTDGANFKAIAGKGNNQSGTITNQNEHYTSYVMSAGTTVNFNAVAKDTNEFTDVSQDMIWYVENTNSNDTTTKPETIAVNNGGKLTALTENAGKVSFVGVSASNPKLKVYIQLYITAAKPTATPTATATPAPTATTAPTTAPATKTGKVTASSLRVRETPVNGTVVGKLAKGTAVTVLETKDGWYKVTAGSLTGWVSGEYVELTTPSTTETAKTTANLKLRQTPKTGAVITTMKKGSKVEVLNKGTEWSKVKYNGKIGYASNAYLEFEEDAVG